MTSRTRLHRAFLQLTALLSALELSAAMAAAQDRDGAAISCILAAAPLAGAGSNGAGERAFEADVECGPGVASMRRENAAAPLPFSAATGERVLIGASLSDESPTKGPIEVDPTPDFDFPVRIVAIDGVGTQASWSFALEDDVAAQYEYLILRVWNEAALADCPEGRDGCRKYGYILLWDERRAEDALELILR